MSRFWLNPNNLTSISFILLALAGGLAVAAFLHGGSISYILGSVGFLLLAITAFTRALLESQRTLEVARLRRPNDHN
jgi:hypothetical protein